MKGIKVSRYINPLYLYAISLIVALGAYFLHWSDYYNLSLTTDLLTFIFASSFISIVLGKSSLYKRKCNFEPIAKSNKNKIVATFIAVGFIAEFIYCGNIPFIDVIIKGIGGYRDFTGIPTIHVVLCNLNLFWGIYIFAQYVSNRNDKELKRYIFFHYAVLILTLNRGALVQLLFSNIFIYLLHLRNLKIKHIFYTCIAIVLFFLAFGIFGNARQANSQGDGSSYILQLGGATDDFVNSGIPKPLFWGYLYVATPIGNLQSVINNSTPDVSSENFLALNIENCLPNFISNRFQSKDVFPSGTLRSNHYLVIETFNAPSVYFNPYLRLGWYGILWMFVFMIAIVFLYVILIPRKSKYFFVGWAGLCTITTLNTFNNMWYYDGGLTLIMITFFAVILEQLQSYFIKNGKNFPKPTCFRGCTSLQRRELRGEVR